jgi:murein DD-endopeptidase MepM/ murein hydrolase activator NlpD
VRANLDPPDPDAVGRLTGHEVYAMESGRVFGAGWQNPRNHHAGLGWRVSIMSDDGQSYRQYGHMDPHTTPAVSTHVNAGDYIGDYANPTNGSSTGPHVHVERRMIRNSRVAIDPGPESPVRKRQDHNKLRRGRSA